MSKPAPVLSEIGDHLPALYQLATRLSPDPHGAADLVHDAYLRAVEKADQYRGDAPLLAWLRRILHNLAVDRARRSSREVPVDAIEEKWQDDAYTVDPAAVAERAATRTELEDALVRLPFIYRTAVTLHDVEGLTVREIADLQDVSLPAAKQRLRRGRMMLVSALAEGHERRTKLKGVPMRCWDARRHISDFLDGNLDHETAHGVEAHLATCPTCPPLYAALVDAQARLGELRDADSVVPPELVTRIQAVLAASAAG